MEVATSDNPLDSVVWEKRDIQIRNPSGHIEFEQKGVECPKGWSDLACRIATHKYFHGNVSKPGREDSIRHLIHRVAATIAKWGRKQEYLDDLYADLCHILVNQYAAFNSPVWINLGADSKPQCSACFILSVEDRLESIEQLYTTEMEIFRGGSGSGVNLSKLRGSMEPLSGGGFAAGPLAFMKGLDFSCGAMKSGGKARRGASMRILDIDHPDIVEYIHLKENSEAMARALIQAGFDPDWEKGVYKDILWQNANNSVRVTDKFMAAMKEDEDWELIARTSGGSVAVHKARDLWGELCNAAWACGDPGVQFHDAVNRWNTCSADGEIVASNPCSEYLHLNDAACNLASLNLVKFSSQKHRFDSDLFERVIRVMITAMDVIVEEAHYPTDEIRAATVKYRPLGLGYSNLGALLMRCGAPYDSDAGRQIAATVTALMQGVAYDQSAQLAFGHGPFDRYAANAACVRSTLYKHWEALDDIPSGRSFLSIPDSKLLADMSNRAEELLAGVIEKPVRNSQVSCLAPCGTIGLFMDCDTMGVEPDLALVKTKQVVGGGTEILVNQSVDSSLRSLGYDDSETRKITEFIRVNGTVVGSGVKDSHLPVFATSLGDGQGVSWRGQILMLATVQPFLSGGISKTVNVPENASPEDVGGAYELAFDLGLKALSVYRDRSKGSQPVSAGVKVGKPIQRKLPDECGGKRLRIRLGGVEVFAHTGEFGDGALGEIFVTVGKSGSTIQGLCNIAAISVSVGLQYGVPVETFIERFRHQKFEPAGPQQLPGREHGQLYTSIFDCISHWLEMRYVKAGTLTRSVGFSGDEPLCLDCGAIMIRSGNCFRCPGCGSTSGCS